MFGLSLIEKHKQEFSRQFYFFQTVFIITGTICWSYFIYLLIRSSNNDYRVIFLNFGAVAIGQLLGLIISALFLGRLGYLKTFRIHNIILFIVTVLTLLSLPHLTQVYIILALLRGFGYGFFWLANNVYSQREIFGLRRGRLLSILNATGVILGIVLPILAGATISFAGYPWIFIIAAAVYLIGIIYPWKYNKVPKDTFRPAELKNFYRKPQFKQWSVFVILNEMSSDQRMIIITALPFLFIGNEFDIGILTSGLGLLAALLIIMHRNDEIRKKIHFGYTGAYLVALSTTFLSFVWNLPAFVFRSIVANFGFAYYSPVETDLGFRVKESVMGEFTQESANEMQVYVETLLTIARVSNMVLAIVLFYVFGFDPLRVMQVLLLLGAIREVIFLFYNTKLLDKLKRG